MNLHQHNGTLLWLGLGFILGGSITVVGTKPIHADVIVYDQSSIANGGNLADISSHRTAEQFVLNNDATIVGFNVFLGELGSFNVEGVFEGFTGLGWAVYSGNGSPGTLQAFGQINPGDGVLTDTFVNSGPNDVFRFDFDIPDLNLTAGGYWLALVEPDWGAAHDGVAIAWYATNQNLDGDYRQELFNKNLGNTFSVVYGGQGRALQVRASTIPEPGCIAICLASCIGTVCMVRRRNQRSR